MIAIVLIAIGFLAGTILALPVLLPEIRKRAQHLSAFRNRTRILFAVMTVFILLGGLSWAMSQLYTGFAKCDTVTSIRSDRTYTTINCNTADEMTALPYELWLRTMLPPSARNVCIFNDTTCDLISEYQVFANDNAMNRWSAYWGLIAATLIGAGVNWTVISFITKPKRT